MSTPEELFKLENLTAGRIIKSFREAFEISQADMAYACKISQPTLSSIEADRIELGPKVALKISGFLGINPSQLLFPNGYESEADFIEIQERTEKIKKAAL